MSVESSGKPDAWKLARPVWGWGRGATPWPTPPIGRQVALQLAAIGVPRLRLVDFDHR